MGSPFYAICNMSHDCHMTGAIVQIKHARPTSFAACQAKMSSTTTPGSAKRRLLDVQAALVAKSDSQFVNKLAGLKNKGLPRSSPSSRAGSSAALCRHAAEPSLPDALAASAALAADAASQQQTGVQPGQKDTAGSPLHCVTPHFCPPAACSQPGWLRASTAPELSGAARTATDGGCSSAEQHQASQLRSQQAGWNRQEQAGVAAANPSAPSAAAAACHDASPHSQPRAWQEQQQPAEQQQQQQQQQQQAVSSSTTGGPDRPDSPSWLLKAAAAGFSLKAGPLQVESSLFRNWTASQAASAEEHAAAGGNSSSSMRVLSAPPGRGSLALGIEERLLLQQQQQQLKSLKDTASCSRATANNAVGPGARIAPATAAGQIVAAAPPVAAWHAGSQADSREAMLQAAAAPCGSNFVSSRAAAAVAGIASRAGVSDKQLTAWFQANYSGSRPPRREDAESLRQWLCQQLQQLQADHPDQPEQQSCSQPERQEQQESAADGGGWSQLQEQTSQLLLQAHGPDRLLDVQRLQQQEAVYSAAFDELCRQVSVGCVERGHLAAQLWLSQRSMMLAALADRQSARAAEAAAHATAAAAQVEVLRLQQLHEDERVALRAVSGRHAAKAEAARQEMELHKEKHEQLQDLLARLSGTQQLMQRVFDLETAGSQQQAAINSLTAQLEAAQEQAEELGRHRSTWQARALAAEQRVEELQEQLGCSTPRPRRDLGLLSDLLTEEEVLLVEQALIAGLSAEQVHRLLLGLTADSEHDVRPWISITGACSKALRAAADPLRCWQTVQQLLVACDAASLARYLEPAASIHVLSQAVHLGASPAMLMQLLDGSLGLPGHPCGDVLLPQMAAVQTQQQQQQQHNTAPKAAAAGPAASKPESKQAQVQQQQRRESTEQQLKGVQQQQQLLAAVDAGLPYLPIVGVLATKFGRNSSELGGPVTEALAHAALSTRDRLQDLELKTKALHREVVLLKRTLAEQRKHEQERIEAALKDQKRKIARREARQPSLLDKFLQTKFGDYFQGIGTMDEVPAVLRASVPINNRHMPKRDAEKLAREIWQFKDEQEAAGARCDLADVTRIFLERRFFAIPRLVTEVAYNFIYSLGQHSYDADCNLFLRVFTGDVEEAVRGEQAALEAEIMRLLTLLDVSINRQATGWLHKADVKTALAGFFKGKKVDRLSELHDALDTDEPGDAFHYCQLFMDDENMNQGMAAETIRSQHLQERLEFLQEIEDVIRDSAEDQQTTSLTPAMLQSCLAKAHKGLDPAALSAFVSRTFGPGWEAQQNGLAQPLGSIIRAIRRGSLQPAMRPTAATAAGAVSKISAVGKFEKKLLKALKVGMSEGPAVAASRRASNVGFAASGDSAVSGGAGGAMASRRRSTAESAAAAGGPARSRRATTEVVSAAVAAVLGKGAKRAAGTAVVAAGAVATAAATGTTDLPPAGSAPAGNSDQQLQPQPQLQQHGSSKGAAVEAQPAEPGAVSDAAGEPAAGAGSAFSVLVPPAASHSFKARAPPPVIVAAADADATASFLLPLSRAARPAAAAAAATPTGSGSSGLPPTTPGGSRRPLLSNNSIGAARAGSPRRQQQQQQQHQQADLSSNGGGGSGAAVMTVGMLSALEAVRQTWLKEEEVKMVAAAAVGRAASGSGSASNPGAKPSPQRAGSFGAGSGAAAAAAATAAAESSGLVLSSSGHRLAAVPALWLGDVVASGGSSAAGTSRTDGSSCSARSNASGSADNRSSRSTSSGGAAPSCSDSAGGLAEQPLLAGDDGSESLPLSSQRAILKPILWHQGSGRAGSKRVVICSNAEQDDSLQQQQQLQLSPATGSVAAATAAANGGGDAVGSSSSSGSAAQSSAAGGGHQQPADAAAEAQPPGQPKDGSSCGTPRTARGLSRLHLPTLPLAAAADGGAGGNSSSAAKRTSSRSNSSNARRRAKTTTPPPLLLLTDADDVCGAATHCGGLLAQPSGCCCGAGTTAGIGCSAGSSSGGGGGGSRLVLSSDGMTGFSSSGTCYASGCMSPGGGAAAGFMMGPVDEMCSTPHEPGQGGKRNALLMRQLNKKKSLKRLEEVMLLVAAQGPDADVGARRRLLMMFDVC